MKRLLSYMILLLTPAMLSAQTLEIGQLKEKAAGPEPVLVSDSLYLSALVVSSPGNENLADSRQISYRDASATMSNRTAYVESLDGKFGARLVFRHFNTEAKKAVRYSVITLNLCGASLRKDANGALVIENIPDGSIVSVVPGSESDIPRKVKALSELSADDIYTWVTVPDCEFVFKDGAYVNILEQYGKKTSLNAKYSPVGYMDTWQTLLWDRNAAPLYLVINSRVPWRRSGAGVPQGTGSISGILLRSDIPRYGHVEAWQIRPMEESDIAFSREERSSFTTLCEWNWNDNAPQFNTTDGAVERFRYEKMLPDIGRGELSLDFLSSTYRGMDVNNPVLEDTDKEIRGTRGKVNKGAMEIRTQVKNWWNWAEDCGSAVVLKFSTKDLDSERLYLAFSFAAGAVSATTSRFAPAFWGVEYSTDNVHIAKMDMPNIQLRTLPWWESSQNGVRYFTSTDAGMGLTEHIVELPSSLIGQETVYVRICPVRKNLTTLAMEEKHLYSLRQNMEDWTFVRFGAISIRYR